MPISALPLKVPSTPSRTTEGDREKTPMPNKQTTAAKGALIPSDISSPHELTAFVETLLEQLDTKFDEMSTQILDRSAQCRYAFSDLVTDFFAWFSVSQMSTRVDALEASIQDIINGDVSVPQSPSPMPGTPGFRRSDSGLQ
ncbi:hypothetical protein BDQ12DRAFT_727772 [Crucibulum laeve]|uniref:Uncharacterized protein n=1 Tax=Crucibulum laeve TaxID=68775 RepID=A0A5C3LME5_9AGAR|nr:hypothetical protein BDQ12DRAFT_727772 [Crucibulum laeve]